MALVVFVFASILMLDEGLKKTLVNTGEINNIILTRKGSDTEVQSTIYRDQAAIIETKPIVANSVDATPLVSKELVVLISLQKSNAKQQSNVVVRGTSTKGFELRPDVQISKGKFFRSGSSDIVIGSAIAKEYSNTKLGDQIYFAQRLWTIVGIFDAKKTAFDSEIWASREQLMQAFRRKIFLSLYFDLPKNNR